MSILAIDPGVNYCGYFYGYQNEDGEIVCISSGTLQGEQWFRVVPLADFIVIEFPQTYRGASSRGDTNDLLRLAARCGEAKEFFSQRARVEYVLPRDWTKQTPKKIRHARLDKKLLTPGATEHERDALGLFEYALKRFA